MRSFTLTIGWVLALAAVAVAVWPAQAGATADPSSGGVASVIDRRLPVLLRRYHASGAAVALVDGGQLVWTHGYGLADRRSGTPVSPDTVFEVGSISKTVTAWGVLRLAEEGKVDLDAPVVRYLPEWQPPPSRFDWGEVTARRLLSHTAGTSVQGYSGHPVGSALPSLEDSLAGRGARRVRLIDAPGDRFHYSGGGYALLQLLVERVSGQPFADYMRQQVLLPLGMRSSGYAWTRDLEPRTAVAYSVGTRPTATRVFAAQAAEGLYTTASDFGRFLAAMADGGGGVLAPQTAALTLEPVPHTTGAGTLSRHSTYGLGTFLEPVAHSTLAYHPGVVRGWAAMYGVRPDRGQGVVVLTNSDTGVHVSGEATCLWSQSVSGGSPQYCRALSRARTAAVATSGSLAAGTIGYLGWFGWELASGRRRITVRRSLGRGALRRGLLAGGTAVAWIVVWHSDAITSHVWQDEVVPAWLLPRAFLWTSIPFVAECVALALTRLTVRPEGKRASRLRLGVPILAALVWMLVWTTGLGTSLVLDTSGLVPARALHSLRWLTWAVPSACALWCVCRLSTRRSEPV